MSPSRVGLDVLFRTSGNPVPEVPRVLRAAPVPTDLRVDEVPSGLLHFSSPVLPWEGVPGTKRPPRSGVVVPQRMG